ncbi:MAG: ferric reductase-like transmembrane domain-containing protein, partial [Ilumatobacteraceae bacterium]
MNEKFSWYLARSSGWVAFVLLAITVVWGILGISKIIERRGLPRWLLDVHRHLALLTIVFTAVHLAALVGDNYMHISWREILVPMSIDYRPGATAFGVVALYLIIAVQVSSWLRSRLPRRVWRGIHLVAYPALWLVAVHGLRAGTDSKHLWVRAGVMVIVGLVAFVTLMRVFIATGGRGRTA